MGKKLSIIIPAYNAEPYLYELLDCLAPQITKDVEVLVIDDGSVIPVETEYKWVKLYRQRNKGLSASRNEGIKKSHGAYISFIDADDLVSETYIHDILSKIPFDYLEMSWKSFDGDECGCKLETENDSLTNCSVCTRAFNRQFIGNHRFNIHKDSTEDEDFSRKIGYERGRKKVITDYSYYYRTSTNVMSKAYRKGHKTTKRITYYYDHVTKDMDWLVKDIKREDERNEVWLLTNKCDIPELKKYCQVSKPIPIWTHILRGERGYRILIEGDEE